MSEEAVMHFKADMSVFTQFDDQLDLSPLFALPMIGISMKEFTDMLTGFVDHWLGPGNHSSLVRHLIQFADGNKDEKVPAY